jgi:hypothetical protein
LRSGWRGGIGGRGTGPHLEYLIFSFCFTPGVFDCFLWCAVIDKSEEYTHTVSESERERERGVVSFE